MRTSRGTANWRWADNFSRSRLGEDVFFVKGTRSTHYKESPQTRWEGLLARIASLCGGLDIPVSHSVVRTPVNPTSYETCFAFLDGGVVSIGGNFSHGHHGTWVTGIRAMRWLCYELGIQLLPRDRPASLEEHNALRDALRAQLLHERGSLESRLTELAAWLD